MATRTGRLAKPDAQGQFVRQLGWKLSGKQTKVQHKFRLGVDKREAEQRDVRLRQLWEQIERDAPQRAALWDNLTLDIAKRIAAGMEKIPLAPLSEDEPPASYARRLQQVQNRFSFLRFVPSDSERYTKGIGDQAYDLRQVVLIDNPYENYWRNKSFAEIFRAPPLTPRSDAVILAQGQSIRPLLDRTDSPQTASVTDDGATLHHAFEAYKNWIQEHYFDDATQALSDYAYTKLGQIDTLKSRHADVPLAKIDYDAIEKMYRFWRQRPTKRTRNGDVKRLSPSSVRHYLGELHRCFKWIHLSKHFAWRKPDGFDEMDRSIQRDVDSVKRSIRKVDTFQLDDLRLLNRYATPIERLYLMLGLNCGFGTKEIATLTIGEVFLHHALPADEQEVFGFPSTDADSFVSIVRNKTMIVGKYLLFGQTVKMLEWIMARRLMQANPAPDQPAILNSNGSPLDRRKRQRKSVTANPECVRAIAEEDSGRSARGHELVIQVPAKDVR